MKKIRAGVVLSAAGSLKTATIRLADESLKTLRQNFEILSLNGTLGSSGCHLHISLAGADGSVLGGHLKNGCIIHTTAEIVLGEIPRLTFTRQPDTQTGFEELVITPDELSASAPANPGPGQPDPAVIPGHTRQ